MIKGIVGVTAEILDWIVCIVIKIRAVKSILVGWMTDILLKVDMMRICAATVEG